MVRALAAAVVAAVLVVPACGSGDDEPSSAPLGTDTVAPTTQPAGTSSTASAEVPPGTVVMVDFRFDPREISVARGESVTWRNDDPYDHWVLATDPDVLDSGEMSQAQTYSHTFPQAGTYEYYCNIHNYMKATVTVR